VSQMETKDTILQKYMCPICGDTMLVAEHWKLVQKYAVQADEQIVVYECVRCGCLIPFRKRRVTF